ncbi:MAG: CDP-alcohol phosphatidyltransferase family protein [Oscillospiraceae bacterium]|nr:CDP-alcohol phosphatidyltransferase family protein [Oscillospiraceae bacterium]MDD6355675.1 CDP-alcohol phosphatidyltransferase family protein [Oscillospiraceae bacterium]
MSKFNDNIKDLFTNWNTIPNWMCFVRIALIPVFTVMFIKGMYIPAFIVMIVAALTDVFDGKIARKFNMVSNLGKMLDPIADKLSQMAIVIILIVKFWDGYLKYILFLFIVKELLMIIGGAVLLSKGMRPVAAEVWGKVATVVFYTFMIIIIALGGKGCALYNVAFFKPFILPEWLITVMVVISAILAFVSLFGYLPGFLKQIKENKQNSQKNS